MCEFFRKEIFIRTAPRPTRCGFRCTSLSLSPSLASGISGIRVYRKRYIYNP